MSRLLGAIGVTRIQRRATHVTGIMNAIAKNILRIMIGLIALFLLASLIH